MNHYSFASSISISTSLAQIIASGELPAEFNEVAANVYGFAADADEYTGTYDTFYCAYLIDDQDMIVDIGDSFDIEYDLLGNVYIDDPDDDKREFILVNNNRKRPNYCN